MKILFDINHPAHVHFFDQPMRRLLDNGHQVVITARKKDVCLALLDAKGWDYQCLSDHKGGVWGLAKELVQRNLALARVVRAEKPDVMASIGGTFIAHAKLLTGVPAVAFYDNESAKLQNLISYPFVSKLCVPEAYHGWLPKGRYERYAGCHELSYLRNPGFELGQSRGKNQSQEGKKPSAVIRLVSWSANHDIGLDGWSEEVLQTVLDKCIQQGIEPIISTERELTAKFDQYVYQGDPNKMHECMAQSRLVIGESVTMAAEAVMLGVPAVYLAHVRVGVTDELESKYGLMKSIDNFDVDKMLAAIDYFLNLDPQALQTRHRFLMQETIDVADYVYQTLLSYDKNPSGDLKG